MIVLFSITMTGHTKRQQFPVSRWSPGRIRKLDIITDLFDIEIQPFNETNTSLTMIPMILSVDDYVSLTTITLNTLGLLFKKQ